MRTAETRGRLRNVSVSLALARRAHVGQREEPSSRRRLPEAAGEDSPAWELVEAGRYMPRRIRGSFRGRELG